MADRFTYLADEESTLPVLCDDCQWYGQEKETLAIHNLEQRIAPGEVVPVGECPKCGALCHYTREIV